ncbi:Uncharacterized protein TCM_008248 [Theobroma cacao]|uniref:RNase H type-1 domain-containing protein n=1 Tax=Theobroma cacao TaxID=3641 RepID=A0A061E3K9_THECC|nr:Uncharacterized protein TCM_008248 [Theobroma cacao]
MKNKLDPCSMMPFEKSFKPSLLWKHITEPLQPSSKFHDLVANSFNHSLGDGSKISLWKDAWIEDFHIASFFPRIFALAVDKKATITDSGRWDDKKWIWDIKLRRQPLSWETKQWTDLKPFPKAPILIPLIRTSSFGSQPQVEPSVHSFCRAFYDSQNGPDNLWKLLWIGLAPPKAETFCWQVLHGKLAAKAILMDRGIISSDAAMCTFSNGISNGLLQAVPLHSSLHGCYTFALLKKETLEKCSSLHLSGPFGCRWNLGHIPTDTCFFQPTTFSNSAVKARQRTNVIWEPLPLGTLKLNIDGAAKGKLGPAGIGGLLRDHHDFIRGTFSHHIGIEDSNFAELQAIHQGLNFFFASPWASNHQLEVESDSTDVILWVKDNTKVPWKMKFTSNAI